MVCKTGVDRFYRKAACNVYTRAFAASRAYRGKTINTTLPSFYSRLPQLLQRNGFKQEFIEQEMTLVQEGYIISKTNSRRMLGSMNAITENLEYSCRIVPSYELINLDRIEDSYLGWLTKEASTHKYVRTKDYWIKKGVVKG